MRSDGFAQGSLVGIGQQALKGMASHHHEVETAAKAKAARVGIDPVDTIAAAPRAGHLQHCGCGVHAIDLLFAGQRRRQKACSAAKVQNTACARCKRGAVGSVLCPAVFEIVEADEPVITTMPDTDREVDQGLGPRASSALSAKCCNKC